MNEAVELLNDYNSRLSAEMEERTKLTSMLRDYQAEQKELLAQAEKRLEVIFKIINKSAKLRTNLTFGCSSYTSCKFVSNKQKISTIFML